MYILTLKFLLFYVWQGARAISGPLFAIEWGMQHLNPAVFKIDTV